MNASKNLAYVPRAIMKEKNGIDVKMMKSQGGSVSVLRR